MIHTQSGLENKVKINLEQKVASAGLQEHVSRVFVPMEEIAEIRRGQKRISKRTFFPGYILIEVDLTDQIQELIRTMPGVSGLVGPGRKPVPLESDEVDRILKSAEEKKAKPKPRMGFARGDAIRIVDGPFVSFQGTVDESYPDKGKLKAMISIFGRSTPVELESWQVEKT